MKWSTWAGLAASFALLLGILATVVILPRSQAAHHASKGAYAHTTDSPAVINLPAITVTPRPSQLGAQASALGGANWPSVSNADRAQPLTRGWLDLGMPYYSFASPVLISVKD